ncbi:MAG TPA: cellulose biosynthesis cyclic di-GMP-binding regulatory protein BcsB [Trinickia sp.]|nr:cellulose biosynthesis cyclic di-GMP-binding regulatory protein BcsB [Trinickia sp.]
MKPVVSFCLSLATLAGAMYSALIEASPAVTPAPLSAAQNAASTFDIPFAALGAYSPLHLRGVDDTRTVDVGVRLDGVVTAARLHLRYTYSPALVFPLSHLKVSINGEAVASVPFDHDHAGQLITQDIPLDPRFFSDYNQIDLQLIAHYSVDHCEDPESSALWADISPTSEVVLDTTPIRLPNDLALLPAPFFDRRDVNRLVLPFVLPPAADDTTLKSAGVLASWFGALADYRQARFPALTTLPADSDAVVVGTPAQLPAPLQPTAVEGATLRVADNPAAPGRKILIVTGRNATEVEQAADALVLGQAAMSGSLVQVAHVDMGPPRQPYDAPRWLPVGRRITFKDIVDDPKQLQVSGNNPDPIRLNLRVPPDLYSWSGQGVPLDLKYRYTAPTVQDDSALSVSINGELVKSFRLAPASAQNAQGRLQLPLMSNADVDSTNSLYIPAFRVGSANQLQLSFGLNSQKTGLCQSVSENPARAAVDPDSTIDFSHFVHYAQMPNLAYFANSGFPFTRYADLAQTAVVIPSHPRPQDLEALLTMLGQMGKWTGFPALRVQIARSTEVAQLESKDLLLIGDSGSGVLPASWQGALPLAIEPTPAGHVAKTTFSVKEYWRDGAQSREGDARLDEGGALAAVVGFEQPGSRGRSVVALTGSDPDRLRELLDVFEKPDRVAQIQGDVALVRGGRVESMRVGSTYVVGYVPWYAQIWGRALRHPVLLGVLGALAGLVLAMGAFTALQALSARRRGI